MKFLFDLFPVILFFIAFKFSGIYVATAFAIGATLLQIGWLWIRRQKIDAMLWISFITIVVFGGATLWLHDESFIKWKPTILYFVFAAALIIAQFLGKQPLRALLGKQIKIDDLSWKHLTIAWAIFFIFLGVLNIVVAFNFSTEKWVTYKLFGNTAITFVFVVAQTFWLAKKAQRESE